MKYVLYQLTMPNKGSWNGKFSGEGELYAKVRSYATKYDTSKIIGSFYYSFGDGWGANVKSKIIDKKETTFYKNHSQGFLGYDWMIDEIEKYGRIRTITPNR